MIYLHLQSVAGLENFGGGGGILSTKPQKFGCLHRNWEWFFGRERTFKPFFRPKSGDLQKKKKKVFTEIKSGFSAENGHSNLFFAQNQVISKKKKVFTEIKSDLSVENGNFFFFWDHLILGEKKVWISVFGEDIRIFEVLCLKSPPPKFSRSATGGTPFAHFAHS